MDKMREEFERWFRIQGHIMERHHECVECYFNPIVQSHWSAWQASRAALCVELPDNLDGEYYADGWNACLIAVGEKIEESGVPYK